MWNTLQIFNMSGEIVLEVSQHRENGQIVQYSREWGLSMIASEIDI